MSQANTDFTPAEPESGEGVLVVGRTATSSDIYNEIENRASFLEAQTLMIYGVGFEAFDSLNRTSKDNYLWSLHQSVLELKALLSGKMRALSSESEPGKSR